MPRMTSRTVNIALLVILVLEIVSGVVSLTVGSPGGRAMFWLHRAGGLALVILAVWKWGVAARSYRKRGVTPSTMIGGLFAALTVAALLTGILWATVGMPGLTAPVLGNLTGLGVHIALSVALIPLLIVHTIQRWQRARRPDFAGRRAALRYTGLLAGGLALWGGQEAVTRAGGLDGNRRRYSGSKETGSFTGNGFPRTNWFTDPVPRLDPEIWTLRITGQVEHELTITYDALLVYPSTSRQAVLDCTGGWYTEQIWSGIPLATLFEQAGVRSSARSILVTSDTGYRRRYPLDEASRLILATHVGDEPLTRGHGYPARLVAPGYRGFEWVKWVVKIELSETAPWLQSPLPLQ